MAQRANTARSVERISRGKAAVSALWITCGRLSGHLRREADQCLSGVQIRVVQDTIEQRREDLTHALAGGNSRDGHHFLAANGEVGDLERGSAAELGLEPRLEPFLVGETLRDQPSAGA